MSSVLVLGDDEAGPHSTAIVVGRRTILACAHSLGFNPVPTGATAAEPSVKRLKTLAGPLRVLVRYWIQPTVTVHRDRSFSNVGRVLIELYKFHLENDWALFTRTDGGEFDERQIARIKSVDPVGDLPSHMPVRVIHCPVALIRSLSRVGEMAINPQRALVALCGFSRHHVKYPLENFTEGSSGGALFTAAGELFAMHCGTITEAKYDADQDHEETEETDKRVKSEDAAYEPFEGEEGGSRKKLTNSESIASMAGGNGGQGSALVICTFPRLMHYISVLEPTP